MINKDNEGNLHTMDKHWVQHLQLSVLILQFYIIHHQRIGFQLYTFKLLINIQSQTI